MSVVAWIGTVAIVICALTLSGAAALFLGALIRASRAPDPPRR